MTERRYSLITNLLIALAVAASLLTPRLGQLAWVGLLAAGLAGVAATFAYFLYQSECESERGRGGELQHDAPSADATKGEIKESLKPERTEDRLVLLTGALRSAMEHQLAHNPRDSLALRYYYYRALRDLRATRAQFKWPAAREGSISERLIAIVRELAASEKGSYEFALGADGSLVVRIQRAKASVAAEETPRAVIAGQAFLDMTSPQLQATLDRR